MNPVTNTLTVATAVFNAIQTQITDVLGENLQGYGTSINSTQVTSDMIIDDQQWLNLRSDISRAQVHQTGSPLSLPIPEVVSSQFTNQLITAANQISTNRKRVHDTVNSTRLLSDDTNASGTRTVAWGSLISHNIKYTWNSASAIQYFFNLGGRIVPSIESSGNPVTTEETAFAALILSANNSLATKSYWLDGDLYEQMPSVGSSKTFNFSEAGNSIDVVYVRKTDKTIEVTISLTPPEFSTINLDITAKATYYYSKSDGGGIAAPRPDVEVILSIGDGGAVIPVPTRRLSIDPKLFNISFTAGGASAYNTVTITNSGNTDATISSAVFTNLGATAEIQGVPTGVVAGNGGTLQFSFRYKKETLDSAGIKNFTNKLTVFSDSQLGDLVIPINVTVTAPAVGVELKLVSPASTAASITSYTPVLFNFGIVPIPGTTVKSVNVSVPTGGNFSAASSNLNNLWGITVRFDPNAISNTTYTTVLTANIELQDLSGAVFTETKSVTLSVEVKLPGNSNYIKWISAQESTNSIIGISYDVIKQVPHLTIGIGLGADGSSAAELPLSTAKEQEYLEYLGVNGDIGWGTGYPMYPAIQAGVWSQFLKDYGVWPESRTESTINVQIVRTYTFEVPTTGTYQWEYSVDDVGTAKINGIITGASSYEGWRTSQKGTITLETGKTHTIELTMKNTGREAGVAFNLVNSATGASVWSTRVPLRSSAPYKYWAEVYRIPVDQAKIYYLKDYSVKNIGAVGNRSASYYFGNSAETSGSMLSISADANGNLSIFQNPRREWPTDYAANDKTIASLTQSLFYYATPLGKARLKDLEPQKPTRLTTKLVGLSKSNLITSQVQIPANVADMPAYVPYDNYVF